MAGKDGNLWFTDPFNHRLGRMTPKGDLSYYAIPTAGATTDGITAGPDGNIWFAENTNTEHKIGRLNLKNIKD